MILDPSTPIQQQSIKPGTVIIEAGQEPEMLCLVHKGEVNCISPKNSGRLYGLGPHSTPGFSALILDQAYPHRILAGKDTVISAFPVKKNNGFSGLVLGKLNVGIMAIRSLLNEVVQAQRNIQQKSAFSIHLQKNLDNLALAYYRCNPTSFDDKGQSESGEPIVDPVMPFAKGIVEDFQSAGGEMPEPISRSWLAADHSSVLNKSYDFEPTFDRSEFDFLKRILSLPQNVQGAIYQADVQILQGIGIRLARLLNGSVEDIDQLQHSIEESMVLLAKGDYSFAEKFYLLSDLFQSGVSPLSTPEFHDVLRYAVESIESALNNYQKLYRSPFKNITPSLQKLSNYVKEIPEEKSEDKEVISDVGINTETIKKELAGSAGKIMNFAGIAQEDAKKMITELKELRSMKNPMDASGDPRKLRRSISRTYWEAYKKCFSKYQDSQGNVPLPVKLMLFYGFFDEEMLEPEHLAELYELTDTGRKDSSIPVYHAPVWLKRIGNRDEVPSIDEMGLSYFEKLKHDHKDQGWRRESDVPDEYYSFDRLTDYEISFFLETNVRLTSGSPATAFPILTKYEILTTLNKAFVTKKMLTETIEKLLAIDYSAFHREVLFNDPDQDILKEFVQQQVIPNFILVPAIGTKSMMWQDLALARLRNSPGRITVPVFATADLFTMLLSAVGAFRWELTKSIMGADWNNIGVSSLTADYTDYLQFFKKNRELSPEIKEKLAAEFKRFRDDRSRFVNDYISWIKYESEGVMKLNKVARGIFYRHVPFAKLVRDKLSNQPAFSDLHNRFTNIRNKKLRELEVRYRKFGDFDSLPPVLKENVEFYKV